jgi:hypothetical protein
MKLAALRQLENLRPQSLDSHMAHAARQIDHHESTKPAPIAVFRERCWARAVLVANNVMTLADAADGLQAAAKRTGLVDELGQDAVQKIMAEAFRWRL